MIETEFFGHPIEYWMELQRRVEHLGVDHLLRDLAEANAKVRYYEMQIDRISEYRKSVNAR
jgi:hypothetical protein